MILEDALGDRGMHDANDLPAVKATLDDLFHRAAAARPDALALVDPPDRPSFTDGPVRRLTYAEADRAISALAARLRGFGLPTDSVVAIQLPNTVESVIAILAVMRAGLIAAPLPLLWRHADAAAALSRVAARALIGCQRIGDTVHGDLAMHIAMETFTIRFVCGFGENLPDGVVPIDDIFDRGGAPPAIERFGDAADHVALVTFDITPEGIVPVARSHAELIAGGLAAHLEARIEPDAIMLGALALASFAGVATTVVPWLLTGGTLALHHPFAPAVFVAQCADEHCSVAVLPGAMAMRLADAGLLGAEIARGAGGLARAGAARGERRMEWRRDPDRRAGVRRDRPPALAPRRRRQTGSVRDRAPGAPARDTAGHACADRDAHAIRNARTLRPDGAARPLPARRRARQRAAPEDRRRQHRYVLSLPRRSRDASCSPSMRRPRVSSALAAIASRCAPRRT